MRRRRRLTAADLGLSPDETLRRASVDLEPVPKRKRGGPSKNEARYQEHLDQLVSAGAVVAYVAQPEPLEIASGVTYQPDFWVQTDDGGDGHYVEVKGEKRGKPHKRTGKRSSRPFFHDDGARVKVRVAARDLARFGIQLIVVWPQGKRWAREVVKP